MKKLQRHFKESTLQIAIPPEFWVEVGKKTDCGIMLFAEQARVVADTCICPNKQTAYPAA